MDDMVMDENFSDLLEFYNNSLEEFKQDGYHPHPANLLAMLLLPEKDRFAPLRVSEVVFYETYKAEIDSKISKVIYDFQNLVLLNLKHHILYEISR